MSPPFNALDSVVLLKDVPDAGLGAGDLATVVHVYDTEAVELEFVSASGRTQAVVTVAIEDVRRVTARIC